MRDYSTERMTRPLRKDNMLLFQDIVACYLRQTFSHAIIHPSSIAFPLFLLTEKAHKDQTDEDEQNETGLTEADLQSWNRVNPQHEQQAHQTNKQKEKIGSSSEQSLNNT